MNAEHLLPVDEIFHELEPEAWEAYQNDERWEQELGSIEFGAPWPRYNEAQDTWYLTWIVPEWHVDPSENHEGEEPRLVKVWWEADHLGNWRIIYNAEHGSESHAYGNEKWSYEKSRERWNDYYEWAAETGKDPIGEFSVDEKETVRWRLVAEKREGEDFVVLQRARRLDEVPGKKFGYIRWQSMPQRIREFCGFPGIFEDKKPQGSRKHAIEPHLISDLSDLREVCEEQDHIELPGVDRKAEEEHNGGFPFGVDKDILFFDIEIEEDIPSYRRKSQVKEKAREALQEATA